MMITVTITDEMIASAEEAQRAIFKTGLTDTPNVTGLHDKDRFVTGDIGEQAFAWYITSINAQYIWHRNINGRPDSGYDFSLITSEGELVYFDVKTGPGYGKYMMTPEMYRQRLKENVYYVAAMWHKDKKIVTLHGFISGVEYKKCGSVGGNENIPVEGIAIAVKDMPKPMESLERLSKRVLADDD